MERRTGSSGSEWVRSLLSLTTIVLFLLPLSGCSSANQVNQPQASTDPKANALSMKPIASGAVTYVALGDSTGIGIGATEGGYVARLFKRVEIVRRGSSLSNLCFSGATSEDVVRNQLERGVALRPTLVTLGIGINDIGHGIGLDQFSANFEKVLAELTTRTSASILVLNIPDISTAPRIPPPLRDQLVRQIVVFNARIAELTRKHNVALFDIYSSTHESLRAHPEFFSGDGFHPSDAGYEQWAGEVWPVIENALKD